MKIRSLLFLVLFFFTVANLWAVDPSLVSKKALFLRAREALKESLASGDMERAETAYGYLKQNVENGAPLNLFEEYLAGMELKHFEDGIHAYGVVRRMMLDTAFAKPKQKRFSVEDELRVYLYRNLSPFNKKVADSLYARIDSSDVTQEYKDLYKTLLYSELVLGIRTVPVENSSALFLVIADTTCAEEFLESSKSFVEKYPLSEHSAYLKDDIIPFVQNYVDKKRLFREDPLAHKYYSGGIGLHFYKWLGLLGGEASDYLDDKMGTSFLFDLNFRRSRISLNWFTSYGLITLYDYAKNKPELLKKVLDQDVSGNLEELTMGAYLGFTAYDSKYLRVEPFIGGSATYYYNLLTNGPFAEFLWGSNVDYRFYATKPNYIGDLSFAFTLRFKYMMQISSLDDECCNDSKSMGVVRHTFALGLGVELW
jgi:hypothetical protein